jgi:hypothetical protein
MTHLRLQIVDLYGQPIPRSRGHYSKKSCDELLVEIIRVDPAADQPGRVAIVPPREMGYYAILKGILRALDDCPALQPWQMLASRPLQTRLCR